MRIFFLTSAVALQLPRRALVGVLMPTAARAVEPCKPNANNCWSTASEDKTKMSAWTWPSGTSKESAAKTLKEVVGAYPQAGQNGVDLGGWTVVDDGLESKGVGKYEFKSGIGFFAKAFNGGKPFVDDVVFEVGPSSVQIFSSSRIGDSDLGVNAKRLNYIAAALETKGWTAPAI